MTPSTQPIPALAVSALSPLAVTALGSAPCFSSSVISAVSLDCAARTNGVAPSSQNHCIVKIVRVSVFSLMGVFGLAPLSSSVAIISR